MRFALAIVVIITTPCQCLAGVTCELLNATLQGWSSPAQLFWSTEIERVLSDRVRVFVATGEFRPLSYSLNGNTASRSSATMERIKRVVDRTESDKRIAGRVQGTEIPIYEVASTRDRDTSEIIRVRFAAYRLPVRAPRDLPSGAHETVVTDADCLVTGDIDEPRAPRVAVRVKEPAKESRRSPRTKSSSVENTHELVFGN